MSTLLFLGASVSQLAATRQARAAGHTVVAVDGDPLAVAFSEADVSEVVDFSDVDAVLEVARRHRVDGVVAVSTDRAVPVAAAVAERLSLPGIDPEVAHAMTNKGAMRELLEAAGIAQPAFLVAESTADTTRAIAHVGLPAVVKPIDSGGQRGLYLVESAAELRTHLEDSLACSRTQRAIVERHVEGDELNAILVVREGEPHVVLLSDRLRPPGVGFGVGWAHVFPSRLPQRALADAAALARDSVTALGLRDGIAFPQLLVDAHGEPQIVEVAARIPAGQMADVVRVGTGVDLVDLAFRFALGHDIPDALALPQFVRPLAVRFFTASPGPLPTGRIVAIDGLEDVRAAPGVVQAGSYMTPGETIHPVQVDADRRGYVLAVGSDGTHALELADAASRRLSVTVESAPLTITR